MYICGYVRVCDYPEIVEHIVIQSGRREENKNNKKTLVHNTISPFFPFCMHKRPTHRIAHNSIGDNVGGCAYLLMDTLTDTSI